MMIQVDAVSLRMMQATIIQDISLDVPDGAFVGIIGPNGSGKSTLLKTMYRVLKPDTGCIHFNERDLYELSSRDVFQKMAVVGQEFPQEFDFSVEDIVAMGRAPHKRMFESDTEEDRLIVEYALSCVHMEDYASRSFMSLSGGEKQRVLIARALAQQARVILLDEPTNHLDIRHQLQVMELTKGLDVTLVAVLHDLNLAAVYCDYLYVMQKGRIVASGNPSDVLTYELLSEVFGVETEIITHPVTHTPYIIFLSSTNE
ncbi:ABC transporter ATP-binding protein [Aneurinibacillus sp. REN35]|uniref:ABC transporter ATP-binding protein n=1 Tax=Aneurinibacillus sp. REN35 TaxID=3237286 RepID=UPI0035286226